IMKQLDEQFGFTEELPYVFFKNNKHKIMIINNEFAEIDLTKLRVNNFGLYFGEIMDSREIRLSIEASQIVGPYATKNIVEVDENTAKKWMYGQDIEYNYNTTGFVILKYKKDFIGCGRYKDGKISNHIPKNRRIGTLK
ncbi:MAG: tRNA pseudouridine(55) synthase TruB, partial [Candidatus Woesearchaeota archaeon]